MVGQWGAFLEKHCDALLGAANALRLDLDGLAYADANGVQVLRRLRARGVRFGGCPPLILEMIDQGTS